jgi:glycosyltransferase involved in cell wall biosynthesis
MVSFSKQKGMSLKIVIVHNYYQQAGGEDRVVALESELLCKHGHQVIPYLVHNQQINSLWHKLRLMLDCIFSIQQYRRFRRFLAQEQPDVVHVHNYFPLLSPAIFYAAKHAGIAVVHSLHNFRAICPSATLFDGTQVNMQSISHSPFWAVRNKIYRQSYLGTLLVYLMVTLHRRVGTWQHQVDQFICLSASSRQLYLAAGWPTDKLAVKPNFIASIVQTAEVANVQADLNDEKTIANVKGGVLFVGRLAAEKGVPFLLQAWSQLEMPLYLVGTGPLQTQVAQAATQHRQIRPLGEQSPLGVQALMQQAALLVVPSLCIETFGLVVLEAFRQKLPVLVADHGALADLVQHGINGWVFKPADAQDFVAQVKLLMQDPALRQQLAEAGWRTVQTYYQPEQNYPQLLAIYQQAMDSARSRKPH